MPNESLYQVLAKGGGVKLVTAAMEITNAGAKHAGDYVGKSAEGMVFTDCARWDGGSGVIANVMVIDGDLQSIEGELWVFDSDPTPPADGAAWDIEDADALRLIGIFSVKTYCAGSKNSIGQSDLMNIPFKCASSSRDLVGCFVTRGAPTYTDGNVTFALRIIQS